MLTDIPKSISSSILSDFCKPFGFNYKEFLVDINHRLDYCNHEKCNCPFLDGGDLLVCASKKIALNDDAMFRWYLLLAKI